MHSTNIIKEIGHPGMSKASDGDTALDTENATPTVLSWQQEQLLAQHSESIHCTSQVSNSETIITETNRSSYHTRKIPATRSNDFLREN